jgi:hypothetical protein
VAFESRQARGLRLRPGGSGVADVARHRCKGGERCAAIVGAKQKNHDAPPSRPLTDVALSSFPQTATGPAAA